MLRISESQIEAVKRHGEQRYPNECCGLLIGRIDADGETREVVEVFPALNAWEDDREHYHRMLIRPEDYLQAELQFGGKGLGVIGNYHSHPDYVAVPSDFDLDFLAPWTTMSYIVISVWNGKATDVRSWELAPDRSQFNEEKILKGNESCQLQS
jgi:proteasome lid subunit RPN8/RPN11